MDNIADALQFYLDNDLNEIISEEPINHLLVKEVINKKAAPVNRPAQNSAAPKPAQIPTPPPPAIAKKDPPVESNNFIKPEFSTNAALSKLAKKFTPSNNNISISSIIEEAKQAAEKANNLEELKKAVEDFEGCNLKKMATHTVFGDGNPDSNVMILGEAPGNDEDLQGVPFCGEAGKMLDKMFDAINMNRQDNIYIGNVLFWRPPGNRKPTKEELAICKPFVERHIALINPDILVLVGSTAMSAILDTSSTISKMRGDFIDFAPNFLSNPIKTFTIFHPSYLIKQPSKKRVAWQDLLTLEKFLNNKND